MTFIGSQSHVGTIDGVLRQKHHKSNVSGGAMDWSRRL